MIWANCSANAMTAGARPSIAEIAVPTNTENTTICRISLLAIASTIDVGKTWVTKSFSVSGWRDRLSGGGGGRGQVQGRRRAAADAP